MDKPGNLYLPSDWDSFIGQQKLKKRLKLYAEAAVRQHTRMPHILLVGPPGTGKTALGRLIAQTADLEYLECVMPIKELALKRIVQFYDGLALFDELHLMTARDQHQLLPLLQSGYLQTDAQIRIDAHPHLTIVGATTEAEKIIKPLWDRFVVPSWAKYSPDDMAKIVVGMAKKAGITMPFKQARILGQATGGVPRHAEEFIGVALARNTVDARLILALCSVTPDGLTDRHIEYLDVLMTNNGTVGLDLLATHLRVSKSVILDLEAQLVKAQYIEYSKSGRVATQLAYNKLKRKVTF